MTSEPSQAGIRHVVIRGTPHQALSLHENHPFLDGYVLLKWILIKLMKKEDDVKKGKRTGHSLGDLIVALYQEAGRICSQPAEQKVMVYSALKHLLRTRVSSKHRIALQA